MNVLIKSDCRKFAPNIFNKSKCQNCFRTKEAHTAEALESNRATRKIAKCGYLFVAPDWDFSISMNRTKRWQRRWFVLYDDGELTYSVDEHPNTIPQALIDMNKVLEVSDAEQITGNPFSLAITAPERVHYVKGTSRDETKWWYDLLSHYPHGTVRSRHKRNATFSGVTSITNSTSNNNQQEIVVERYPRTHSFTDTVTNNNINNKLSGGVELQWSSLENAEKELDSGLVEDGSENNNSVLSRTEEIENLNNLILSSLSNLTKQGSQQPKENHTPLDKKNGNVVKSSEVIELEPVKGSSRRYVKRENRGLRSQRSRSDGVSKMIPISPNTIVQSASNSSIHRNGKNNISDPLRSSDSSWSLNCHENPVYLHLSESTKTAEVDQVDGPDMSPLIGRRRRHASMGQEKIKENKHKTKVEDDATNKEPDQSLLQSPLLVRRNTLASTRGISRKVQETLNIPPNTVALPALDCSGRQFKPCSRNNSFRKDNSSPSPQIRGDPDGLANQEMPGEISKEGYVEKKGWLLRLGLHKEWYKHWFVLKNSTLSYFRDPSGENSGIMDGILDLGLVKEVNETSSDRNHAFSITTWDNKRHVLAALMPAVRSLWVESIIAAANIRTKPVVKSDSGSGLQLLLDESRSNKTEAEIPTHPDCSSSTSSDDHSEYFSVVDEDDLGSRSSSPKALPPSPPINRTAISRVKQKARSRSNSRSRISKRKLRSSSDISNRSWEGDVEEGAHSEGESSHTLTNVTKDIECLQSTPKCRENDPETDCGDAKSSQKTYRNLVDKYNYLRKQLNEHASRESPRSPTENVLKLLADCKVCLARVQDAANLKSAGDLGEEWNQFRVVCDELDKLVVPSSASLSHKEIVELTASVEKARDEIRRLKKDLKCSQDSFDDLELHCFKLGQDKTKATELHLSHMALMTARVDDLTSKLTCSERSLRLAKQRVAKLEARQERRRSSLKGKEAVSLSKEFEGKLSELELKIGSIEMSLLNNPDSDLKKANPEPNSTSESSSTNMLLRLHSLDNKVKNASCTAAEISPVSSSLSESITEVSTTNVTPLEKPKICLQIKGVSLDDSISVLGTGEDIMEHWSSLSVTTSMSDLHTIEPEEEIPSTMEECLNALTQKLEVLLNWLQSSFQFLSNPSYSPLEQRLPTEHLEAAKKLEDMLSNRGGLDESQSDIVCYLHLLQEAAITVRRFSESQIRPQNGHKIKSLLSRLKKASSKISLILDLESQPQNFLDCVQKLLSLATPAFESVTAANPTVEEIELLLEKQVSQLTELKGSKMEDVISEELEIDQVEQPILELQNELEELLEQYNSNCCSDFDSSMQFSSKELTPMKVLKTELEELKFEIIESGHSNKSSIERLALIASVKAILTVAYPSLAYQSCCVGEEGSKWSMNVLVGMLEILLVKWTSQLIFQTASSLSEVLKSKETEVNDLKFMVEVLKEEENIRKQTPCMTCKELQQQVCRLQTDLRSYQRRMGQGGAPCERCRELHRRLEILSERHQMELASSLDREREEHRSELQSRLAELLLSHESEKNQDREELAKLKKEVRLSESQVKLLKQEFQEQMVKLQATYKERETPQPNEKYQVELEELKAFCEKGLQTVEDSYQVVLQDLTIQHQKELDSLRMEKEKALAEESRATATALEALRRTHREELRKALDKLREELRTEPNETGINTNWSNLDTVKKEILRLSEKYSIKCLEHSLLEEKLSSLSRQLDQSSQQVFKLVNRQLNPDELQQQSEDYVCASPDRLRQLLELRENQLETERGERNKLAQQLYQARSELAQLDVRRIQQEERAQFKSTSQEFEQRDNIFETLNRNAISFSDECQLSYVFPSSSSLV